MQSLGTKRLPAFGSVSPTNRLFQQLVLTFFFLQMVFPAVYQLQRGAILGIIVMFSAFYLAKTARISIARPIILIYGACLLTTLFFMLRGDYFNTPGALAVVTVYVVWPTLYLMLIGLNGRQEFFVSTLHTIMYATIFISLIALFMLADAILGLGLGLGSLIPRIFGRGGVGIYDGVVEYSLPNMTTLLIGVPVAVSLITLRRQETEKYKVKRFICYLALALALMAAALSGRRALIVIVGLAPIFSITFLLIGGVKANIKSMVLYSGIFLVCVLFLAINFAGLDLSKSIENFMTGFNVSASASSVARANQFSALIEEWSKYPLLGNGLGASVKSVIRAQDMPWAYELTYVALLFAVGMVGFAIYSLAVLWIFLQGLVIVQRSPQSAVLIVPVISALACMLVANGTNPYLFKFDYLWTLFLPVAILNHFLLRKV
jgi:hypothetical protein